MKKIYAGIAVLLLCGAVKAQYKKATFLSKEGRTYDIGTSQHFMKDGSARTGFYLSYGRDKGHGVFYWVDAAILLPGKFNYTTTDADYPERAVTVSGKTKLAFLYRYNIAYHLINSESSEAKFKPFLTAGLNFALAKVDDKTYLYAPVNATPRKVIGDDGFSYGINAGAGALYNFTETLGIKLMGGYNVQISRPSYDDVKPFYPFTNHPYASLGLRFTISGKDD